MTRVSFLGVVAIVLHGCGGGAVGSGPSQLEVSSGIEPQFSWGTSGGYAVGLRVSDIERPALIWRLRAASGAPSGFFSGVQYGTIPEGGEEVGPAIPLVHGRRYRLAVDSVYGTDTLEFVP